MGMSITHEYREVCGQAFVNWRLEWNSSRSNETQHVYFFTRDEAEATKRAVIVHCALKGIEVDRLTSISLLQIVHGLKRGQTEPTPTYAAAGSTDGTVH